MFDSLPVWALVLITLLLTHITIASVTIYLHRCQAHKALELGPIPEHLFRFWLWLSTGIVTREWVAVHRRHHARVETPEDPHSPVQFGIRKVLLEGYELYRKGATDPATVAQYGHDTPDDWLERHLYSRYSYTGIAIMLLLDILLFGAAGITVWAVQMIWIPVFAAGVINGLGHWWGYRNYEPADASTNILPFGILVGGEELHNNHHAFASSARFSSRWYEVDLGWFYIRILSALGMARVKKLAPRPVFDTSSQGIDLITLRAIVTNRLHVMSRYTSGVIKRVYKEERRKARAAGRRLSRAQRSLLIRHHKLLDDTARQKLDHLLAECHALGVVYEFSQRLQSIWQNRTASQESLIHMLGEWCHHAEQTGIAALEEFARELRTYRLQEA